jgi:two-component system, LytTR family, response regulator
MIQAVAVDDEKAGRENLKALLGKYCPQVKVIGEASNPPEAIEVLNKLNPQLLFLDIEMPFGNGFDLLATYEQIPFEVIFVTAFEKYALRAIRLSACDYIMKPIEITELVSAVNKAAERIALKTESEQLKTLLTNIKGLNKDRKIALPTVNGLVFIKVMDIVRCQADGGYTWFYFSNGKKVLVTKGLGEYEDLLGSDDFIRVHHADLVSRHHVVEIIKTKLPVVKMSDGSAINVSWRKRDALQEMIDGNSL